MGFLPFQFLFWSESKKNYPRKGESAKPMPKKELIFR